MNHYNTPEKCAERLQECEAVLRVPMDRRVETHHGIDVEVTYCPHCRGLLNFGRTAHGPQHSWPSGHHQFCVREMASQDRRDLLFPDSAAKPQDPA